MKTWPFTFIALSFLNTAVASTSSELTPVIRMLDEKITDTRSKDTTASAPVQEVEIPLEAAFARESALWNTISAAYDHLRSYDLSTRHRFLYFAARAAARPGKDKAAALKSWLKEENHLIQRLGQPRYFYTDWNKKVSAVNKAIGELEAPAPKLKVKPEVVTITKIDKEFLSALKQELHQASARMSARKVTTKAPEVSLDLGPFSVDSLQYVLYMAALVVAFLIGLSFRKSKEEKLKQLEESDEVSPPALPIEVQPVVSAPVAPPHSFYFDQGVNLEEECKRMMAQSSHLLEIAQLKVLPTTRSPFKTSVDAPAEKVSEALKWLLKGTLAIANSNGGKVSHLEWQCREQHGRVSLEFILHGLECDLKGLYLNTLVEGEGSAPAHFGRSEMALAQHLASVGFKSGNKKTTISFGLDTLASTLNH